MAIHELIICIFILVCSVALIAVVVMQTNRGSDMAAITGRNSNASGKGQSAKKDMLLKRLTIALGMLFVVSVFVMDLFIGAL